MSGIESLIKDNIRLPSPPAIAVKIIQTVKDDNASFGKLADIVSSDPALSARILKVANSSFYAPPFKIGNIEKAITLFGVNTLKNIALSFVIARDMRRCSNDSFDFEFFWKRSVTAAVGADILASLINYKSDDTFVTALLQDIGIVIMHLCRSDDYLKVIDEKKTSRLAIDVIEKKLFGFDHQEIGAEILKNWGFPGSIYMPIRYHHSCKEVPGEYRMPSDILLLSDYISSVYHGTRSNQKIENINNILCKHYGINEDIIKSTIDNVAHKSTEIFSSFEIESEDMKPFSVILQEANEELGKLNFSYEQLILELKQSKKRAEVLAQELKDANSKLRKLASRDGLTGLYNYRYFQEIMKKELSRAIRYKRPFSLVMFDLDHFKKINDEYGHPRGDIVLKRLSELVMENVRASDIVARYGGEEFTIVLPETDMKGAVVIGERLRKLIHQSEIATGDDIIIKITISVGITTYLPEKGMLTLSTSEMIDAADKALYKSKNTGRNKISIVDIDNCVN